MSNIIDKINKRLKSDAIHYNKQYVIYIPETTDNRGAEWFYIEDKAGRIAYVQNYGFSSVHKVKAGSGNGNGFGDCSTIEEAFSCPSWARNINVEKYRDFEEYQEVNTWKKYVTVPRGTLA